MKVLCVDGPKQGSIIDVDDNSTVWVVPIPRTLTLMSIAEEGQFEPSFDTAVYYISTLPIFGELIAVGTVSIGGPSYHDLGCFLLSSEAKSAVRS